ncbi:hypothetical protein D3C87_1934300 [compost metagenome]
MRQARLQHRRVDGLDGRGDGFQFLEDVRVQCASRVGGFALKGLQETGGQSKFHGFRIQCQRDQSRQADTLPRPGIRVLDRCDATRGYL